MKIEKIENDEDEKSCDTERSLSESLESRDFNDEKKVDFKDKDKENSCLKCLYRDWPQKLHHIKLSILDHQLKQFVQKPTDLYEFSIKRQPLKSHMLPGMLEIIKDEQMNKMYNR